MLILLVFDYRVCWVWVCFIEYDLFFFIDFDFCFDGLFFVVLGFVGCG